MIRGTRILEGKTAEDYRRVANILNGVAISLGYSEIILPALCEPDIFTARAGDEIINQMWSFETKGGDPCCLIPEATALVCDYFKNKIKSMKKPVRVFYISKCYRYERPQAGRYREFTQFGFECLGPPEKRDNMIEIMKTCLDKLGIDAEINTQVSRGLHYYTGNGFEASFCGLGAQKQIAGGGDYDIGSGFAFGVDRLILCKDVH